MAYLPRRRFRPAGTRTGRSLRSPAISSTIPAWLRNALATGRDGLAEARDGRNFRPQDLRGLLPSQLRQPQLPRPVQQPRDPGFGRGRGTNRAPERDQAQPPDTFLDQLFSNLFQGGDFDLGARREENRAANLGGFFGLFDEPLRGFPELRGDIGAAFEGLRFGPYAPPGRATGRSDILDFTSNLFENITTPGQNFQGQEGLRGTFLSQGEGGSFPGVGSFGGDRGASSELTNILGIDVAPGSGGGPPGTGEFLLRQFAAQDQQALFDYYAGLAAPPPAFFGGGGGGGGGGGFNFNFPDSDPIDPRFWVDMVRWLIS